LKPLRVSIVGLGYVGLSTGACLASKGITVYGLDVDEAKLKSIREGKVPFEEEGLEALLKASVKKGLFLPGTDYREAIENSEITFLAVGTPSLGDGSIDLGYLKSAAEAVGRELPKLSGFHHVVVRSTAVPGTTQKVVREALERSSGKICGKDFGLASNPEFLREGSAVKDTMHPDAIVIGAIDKRTETALLSLYKRFYGKLPPVVSTSAANAELIKYASNAFRATQLSFLNTFANLCAGIDGADVDEVARGLTKVVKADSRYLKAGLGFGGSCLPKDLRALVAYSKSLGTNSELLEATLSVNEMQPKVAVKMARELVGLLAKKKVAVLGLAFKARTDDVRESAAIRLVERLLSEGARVTVYDPKAMGNAKRVLEDRVNYAESARECLRDAECCVVATGWPEFAAIGAQEFKQLMRNPAVLDGRRAVDAVALRAGGVNCVAIGSGLVLKPLKKS
jgi:nucleotide sugar dehydrogenase